VPAAHLPHRQTGIHRQYETKAADAAVVDEIHWRRAASCGGRSPDATGPLGLATRRSRAAHAEEERHVGPG
jgi:hypothetical protein